MNKRLVGKSASFSFDFELPDEETNPSDLGTLYHGVCDETRQPVIVRHIANTKLVKGETHIQLMQRIFEGMNSVHGGVVKTFGVFADEDGLFIVREKLQGIDLQSVIFSGDYPHLRQTAFFLRVGRQVCDILSALHANKIVHRRIQPSTIFLVANELGQIDVENPSVKLLNMEYAQVGGQSVLAFPAIPYALYYSSPEQVLQEKLLMNEATDLYSLGITLYEAIARRHAFECDKDDNNLILNMQLSYPLKKSHRTTKEVFAFLQKATMKHIFSTPPMRYKPEARLKFLYNAQVQRYQSAREMKQELETLLQKTTADEGNGFLGKVRGWLGKKS